jgi:hypothetical protein
MDGRCSGIVLSARTSSMPEIAFRIAGEKRLIFRKATDQVFLEIFER